MSSLVYNWFSSVRSDGFLPWKPSQQAADKNSFILTEEAANSRSSSTLCCVVTRYVINNNIVLHCTLLYLFQQIFTPQVAEPTSQHQL